MIKSVISGRSPRSWQAHDESNNMMEHCTVQEDQEWRRKGNQRNFFLLWEIAGNLNKIIPPLSCHFRGKGVTRLQRGEKMQDEKDSKTGLLDEWIRLCPLINTPKWLKKHFECQKHPFKKKQGGRMA